MFQDHSALQRMVLGLFRPSFIQFLYVFHSSTDQRNCRSWAMRMRCCQTRTGLGIFLEFLGRLQSFATWPVNQCYWKPCKPCLLVDVSSRFPASNTAGAASCLWSLRGRGDQHFLQSMDVLRTRSSQGLQDTLSPTHGRELIACFLCIAVRVKKTRWSSSKHFGHRC